MDINNVMQIAEQMDMRSEAQAVAASINKINAREMLHVGFVGAQNSGKTALINAAVGQQLREVSNFSQQDALPMKVTFERMEDDCRFECHSVFDQKWHDTGAVLFEFKIADLLERDRLVNYADDIDFVFYLVSAMNAFTSDDIVTLRGLSTLKIRPILTKLDAVDSEERDSIIAYANKMSERLGLPEPLIIDKSNWNDAGRILRDALPIYSEQRANRESRCDALLGGLKEALRKAVNEKLKACEAPASDQADRDARHSAALAAKTDILQLGHSRARQFEEDTALNGAIVAGLMKSGEASGFSKEWLESSKSSVVEPLIEAAFEEKNARIGDCLYKDCIGISSSPEREKAIRDKIDALTGNRPRVLDARQYSSTLRNGETAINMKTVGITAAAAAGAFIIPMPPLASFAVSAGAIAIGAGMAIGEKKALEREKWQKNIRDYADSITRVFCEGMVNYNNEIYLKMADYLYALELESSNQELKERELSLNAQKNQYVQMLQTLV